MKSTDPYEYILPSYPSMVPAVARNVGVAACPAGGTTVPVHSFHRAGTLDGSHPGREVCGWMHW